MQDFAKTRSITGRELAPSMNEWNLDAGSVLFGVLLGAIVAFAGLKAAEYREIQSSDKRTADDNAVVEESEHDFEFYEVLKRNDLYPPLNN